MSSNIWKLSNMLLNKLWVKEEITMEMRAHLSFGNRTDITMLKS